MRRARRNDEPPARRTRRCEGGGGEGRGRGFARASGVEGGVTGGRVDVRRDAAEHARCAGSGLGSLPEPPCGVGAPTFGKDQCEKEEGGRRCERGFGSLGFGGRYGRFLYLSGSIEISECMSMVRKPA